MTTDRALWVVVSPVYRPAPGGGAIYNDLLARHLANAGEEALFIVEKFPGQPDVERIDEGPGRATVRRLFPFRAGRSARDLKSYASYAIQALQMLALPAIIRRAVRRAEADRAIVIIHSSFFYKPSPLPRLLGALSRVAKRTTLVLDVRDPVFGDDLAPIFRRFDAAIGCSLGISERLTRMIGETTAVHHVPVPFEQTPPTPAEAARIRARLGVEGMRYLLNPNGILDAKGYPVMIEAVRALRDMPGFEDVVLVTIGRSRDRRERDAILEREGVTRYLGVVSNREALAIADGGLLTLILSKNEGLPRSSLESFGLGKKVLVPALPEFERAIPQAVAVSDDPGELAMQIARLLRSDESIDYPVGDHAMAALLPSYLALKAADRDIPELETTR